jgi:hypothetical protein
MILVVRSNSTSGVYMEMLWTTFLSWIRNANFISTFWHRGGNLIFQRVPLTVFLCFRIDAVIHVLFNVSVPLLKAETISTRFIALPVMHVLFV